LLKIRGNKRRDERIAPEIFRNVGGKNVSNYLPIISI
jgi:hypothetical protein